MSNKQTYESSKVIETYIHKNELTAPEQTIYNIIKNNPRKIKMLDLGVGCGRTTESFSKVVGKYVGADYSEGMISACNARFPCTSNVSFVVADARNLKQFKDNSFDFVLFSFNGIDYVNNTDRLKILKEIRRVLKNNGLFAFSSHNTQSIPDLFSVKTPPNILKIGYNLFKVSLLYFFNGLPSKFVGVDWVIINDGAHKFGLNTYYISPKCQIKQLESEGFNKIQLFSLCNGNKLNGIEYTKTKDPWIYYLCIVVK
jgi:ubiquinone/menaquinone biosynthesis C-methylase UbiE